MPDVLARKRTASKDDAYQRYRISPDNISEMAVPGDAGCMYTADGLEHDEAGVPSSMHADHLSGLDKRRDKIEGFDYGSLWADAEGEAGLLLITWGSVSGAVLEAAARMREAGRAVRTLCIRLLSPLRIDNILAETLSAKHVLVVEQNHGAQLFMHLRAHGCLPAASTSFARPGPLPIRPGEIVDFANQES